MTMLRLALRALGFNPDAVTAIGQAVEFILLGDGAKAKQEFDEAIRMQGVHSAVDQHLARKKRRD